MNRQKFSLLCLLALIVAALAGCKSSGMAVTGRGQLLKINIEHSDTLPNNGEGNVDVIISNRGVNNVKDILVDVQVPPELLVTDQTNNQGVQVMHDPGMNVYHFSMSMLHPGEDSKLRFHVRTAFGTGHETGPMKVTAWQKDLPGDRLVETATIKMSS